MHPEIIIAICEVFPKPIDCKINFEEESMGWNKSLIAESSKARLRTNKKSIFNITIKNIIEGLNTIEVIDNSVKTKIIRGKINSPALIPYVVSSFPEKKVFKINSNSL